MSAGNIFTLINPSKLRNILAHARTWLDAPVITLDITESTNNDAIRLIDADKALPGTTITAAYQTEGRGQRGKSWLGKAGESLMMSMITVPPFDIEQQPVFSALVAVAIAGAIHELNTQMCVRIKWPNDIIINDKKAGGILIENVLRGQTWLYGVIGLGLNVLQEYFDEELPHATSIKIESEKVIDLAVMLQEIRQAVFKNLDKPEGPETILRRYNELLFRRDELQGFYKDNDFWKATIKKMLPDGRLEVQLPDSTTTAYTHGNVEWRY